MKKRNVFHFFLLLFFLLVPTSTRAHEIQKSTSELVISSQEADWIFSVHLSDFEKKFYGVEDSVIQNYLPTRMGLTLGESACSVTSAEIQKNISEQLVLFKLHYHCPEASPKITVSYNLFYGDLNHRHILKCVQNSQTFSHTFSPEDTEVIFSASGSTWQTLRNFVALGIEHILTGWDHILFILTLILVAKNFKRLLIAATLFTLAHSVSLALSTFNLVQLSSRFVEPTIAASIVWMACRGFFYERRESVSEFAVIFLFGLIHGLGFSGALRDAHLESQNLLFPLLGFNLGVEFGQILILATVYPLNAFLKKILPQKYLLLYRLSLAMIAVVGGFWFFERVR